MLIKMCASNQLSSVYCSVSSLHVCFLRSGPSAASLTELRPGVGDAALPVGRRGSRSHLDRTHTYTHIAVSVALSHIFPPPVILWCHP